MNIVIPVKRSRDVPKDRLFRAGFGGRAGARFQDLEGSDEFVIERLAVQRRPQTGQLMTTRSARRSSSITCAPQNGQATRGSAKAGFAGTGSPLADPASTRSSRA